MAWDKIYETILFLFVHRRRLTPVESLLSFFSEDISLFFLCYHLSSTWRTRSFLGCYLRNLGFVFISLCIFKGGGRSKYNGLCSG